MSEKTYVYLVFRNADMTEGRGPMVFDKKVFSSFETAADYTDRQTGVMGRKAKWSEQEYGDWQIRIAEVKHKGTSE